MPKGHENPHRGRDANLLETGKRAASVSITNTNCTTVLGRVIDEAGCPIVGATVAEASVEELDLDAACPQGVAWTDTGVSSAVDGTVHLQVPRVQSALSFVRFEHPAFRSRTVALIVAEAGPDRTLTLGDIVLEKGIFIEGRVIDEQRAPVARRALQHDPGTYRSAHPTASPTETDLSV